MNSDLSQAKRALEKNVDAVTKYMPLYQPELKAKHSVDGQLSSVFMDACYFQANAANRKTFERHVAALLKAEPSLSDLPHPFSILVQNARNAYTVVELGVKAEKARLAEKRHNVAAKAALRAKLDLQEGVELQGVDVGQYGVILQGLEPVRLAVFERSVAAQEADVQQTLVALQLVQMNRESYNPYPRNSVSEAAHAEYKAKNALLHRYFRSDGGYGKLVALRADVKHVIETYAAKSALAYIQGYAVKLALKSGEAIANEPAMKGLSVASASVDSDNLWRDSVATLTMSDGKLQVWHTQMIWNTSCLGNSFNQWPTRRVS